jgi:hypothetical protein
MSCIGVEAGDSIVRLNQEQARKAKHRDIRPTIEAYGAWQVAFDYFNRELFADELPDVLITLARKSNALGYFWRNKFENSAEVVSHEIAMNPQYLGDRDDRDVLSTLVHEMVHHWREVLGPLNKRGGKGSGGYHDQVWADKMDELGLPPKNIGSGTGKRTGYRVTHSILDGGPFDVACRALLQAGYAVDWKDAKPKPSSGDGGHGVEGGGTEPPSAKKDRVKFTCTACGLNAWAKPSARFFCAACSLLMISQN